MPQDHILAAPKPPLLATPPTPKTIAAPLYFSLKRSSARFSTSPSRLDLEGNTKGFDLHQVDSLLHCGARPHDDAVTLRMYAWIPRRHRLLGRSIVRIFARRKLSRLGGLEDFIDYVINSAALM